MLTRSINRRSKAVKTSASISACSLKGYCRVYMTPTIYINLEDDVSAVAARLKRERSPQVVLVCPKRCFLFSDPINLKLLKTQVDLLGKEVYILTMDEKG